jgi:hypothetical protein
MSDILKDFDDLLNMGACTRSVTVGKHEIQMRTLKYEDIVSVAGDGAESASASHIKILSMSIQTIDGKPLSMEDKMTLLKSAQIGLVNVLMAEYEKLIAEHDKMYDDVKKNTSSTSPKTS